MLAQEEKKEKALCQAISLNLLDSNNQPTKLLSGDVVEINRNGLIKVVRGEEELAFDIIFDNPEERKIFYLGSCCDALMVGMVKLMSAFMGVRLVVLEAEKNQCRFLVNSRE